jgi:(1->4)-alpha-D-glucan 1-alpha-D-glucosylmutase
MSQLQDLDRLCQLYGIETEYHDIWGKQHSVPTSSKQSLLASMGVPVNDPQALHAALAGRERHAWRRSLPIVQVTRASDAPVVALTLPQTRARERFSWLFTPEYGDAISGELHLAGLKVLEQKEFDGIAYTRYAFALPFRPDPGYHRLELVALEAPVLEAEPLSFIVTPDCCYQPPALEGDGRLWGFAIQLYALRSQRNWGIGDFTDLRNLVQACAGLGAGIVGVNPLHALYPHNPAHASPYSPSSRLYTNVLYLDVEAVPEFSECRGARELTAAPEFQQRLRTLRESAQVDYAGVAAAKLTVLEMLYKHFRRRHLNVVSERGKAFRAFQAAAGDTLHRQALFEALQEHFHRADAGVWGWPVWPRAYRNPASTEVSAFAARKRRRVEFYEYLQWQAELQLASVATSAREHRLGIGLYEDLAVSVDGGGAEAWGNQHTYAVGASIGAPPDDFNLQGQNWGLPPLNPDALEESAYNPFIATLRANMRHAGALRIDHVMALMRLFWIPQGLTAADGAYVHYAFDDLLGIVALESQRNRCLVIGEDLGTVPDIVRDKLAHHGVLSYRLLYFQKDERSEFLTPAAYRRQALVAVTTHDLPTLAGFWQETDLKERAELHMFPSAEVREQQVVARREDRACLVSALQRESLLPEGLAVDAAASTMSAELARAIHAYLARTPAAIMMVQLEDVLGELRQVNLPGTTDERPNWRCKLSADLDKLLKDKRLRRLADVLNAERPLQALATASRTSSIVPDATYRLQFNRDFTFTQATALVPYLQRLGISHCYASPYLKARAGSRHGYDIVDHNALNPEIGSAGDFDQFVDTLREHGMGQVLDIVPNHMGVGGDDNGWWLDVLENGAASAYAQYFDIDWRPLKQALRGKVLLPVLGDHYGLVLERGKLKPGFDAQQGTFAVRYYQHLFPLDPRTYPRILGEGIERLQAELGGTAELMELESLLVAFRNLPPCDETAAAKSEERRREKEILKRHLAELAQSSAPIRQFIADNVARFGTSANQSLLHALLEEQPYRLAYWRVAADEINYRRFFDINDLAGLCMENAEVFAATHRFIIDLVVHGKLDGLRLDHPDGLYDPAQYYARLQQGIVSAADALRNETAVPVTNAADGLHLPYIVAEKILAAYEHLPEDWPIQGTTGYDFANLVNGLFVYAPAEREMDRIYHRFVRRQPGFDELLYERKKLIMKVSLSSELNVLANRLSQLAESDPLTRDFTLTALRDALTEVVACFPVYRTYVTGERVTGEDRRYVDWAIAQAKKRNPAADISIFDFIRDVLLLEGLAQRSPTLQHAALELAMRFQQYTAPVMAKGLEDTTFYIYNRLVSLNEVGGDPRRFGVSINAFHYANQERARRWPHALLATSTHDSKRSEDMRTRINVLTEMASEWYQHLGRWSRVNRGKKRRVSEEWAPSRNDEYLLYQTLVGAWPLQPPDETALASFRERIRDYMLKAIREAKVYTSWINPNIDYEEAVVRFVEDLLSAPEQNPFLVDFIPFQQRIARAGMYNSLSQVLLKLTAPGVPDLYQGNELWDLSLVDPDNRRPVDYAQRQRLLQTLEPLVSLPEHEQCSRVRELLDHLDDSRAKLYLTWRTLVFRRAHDALFKAGSYIALAVVGPRAEHVCAFARYHEEDLVIAVATRWFTRLSEDGSPPIGRNIWQDSVIELPSDELAGRYCNILTGERLSATKREAKLVLALADVFANFPVALLTKL